MAVQFHTGLADNGDFTRSIKFFQLWPGGHPAELSARNGTALWYAAVLRILAARTGRLRHHHEKIVTSAALLWLPGVLMSARRRHRRPYRCPGSRSCQARAAAGGALGASCGGRCGSRQGGGCPGRSGGPLVLLLTTTDNAAYLNSFYQEAASQVYVLPALVFAGLAQGTPFLVAPRGGGGVAWRLLTASKSSTIYWPLLALPFGLYAWTAGEPRPLAHAHAASILAAGLMMACLLTAGARLLHCNITRPTSILTTASFTGALMFSREPAEQLRRLGLSDGADCLGVSAYEGRGKVYFNAHLARMSFS